MARLIYRYDVPIQDEFSLELPQHAEILTVQVQPSRHEISLWVFFDEKHEFHTRSRIFRVIGTGTPIPEEWLDLRYISTVQTGPFVWHIFEALTGPF